jgi:hypothetical protein
MIAVGHGREGAVERKNFEAVARKIEVANDFRAEKRYDLGKDREFEAGNDFFGDGSAAENVAALKHEYFLSSARKVSRIDEAVVAATDDNYVVALCHEDFLRVPRGKNKCGKSRGILQARVRSDKAEARLH